LNSKEQQLLARETGGVEVLRRIRTRTCIDVGLWWRRRPLWLCVTRDELVLLAVSRRLFCERIPLSACRGLSYSPAAGELVISSNPPLRFPRLKMPPSTALEVIDLIKQQSSQPTPHSHD